MKTLLVVSLLLLTGFGYAQCEKEKRYIEFGDRISIISQKIDDEIFQAELTLVIKHENLNYIVTAVGAKDFEEAGIETEPQEYLKISDLQKMTSCEAHDLLSQQGVCLIKKTSNEKHKYWVAYYNGTQRNTVRTVLH
jgi:hypothetical protein